jgi:hypothetical protein
MREIPSSFSSNYTVERSAECANAARRVSLRASDHGFAINVMKREAEEAVREERSNE